LSRLSNINAMNVVTLSWRATKGSAAISSLIDEIASFHSQPRIVKPVPSKEKESSPLLAMTQELMHLY